MRNGLKAVPYFSPHVRDGLQAVPFSGF